MKTALRLALLLICSWLAVTSAAESTSTTQRLNRQIKPSGERRQIFRDEVDHLKGVNRPVESNYGFYEPQEEQYDRPPQPSKPVYQDDYRPEFPQSYRPTFQDTYQETPYQDVNYQSNDDDKYKPNYQLDEEYKPDYEIDQKPAYQDDYKPPYQEEGKPVFNSDYKPFYDEKPSYQGDYKPPYEEDYKPTYQDSYKPNNQDNYKPTYQDDYAPPSDEQQFGLDFKPIDFNLNFFGSDFKRPSLAYEDDQYQYEEQKPYVPPQYDDYYEPVQPEKPYKPVAPKPYKPRPTYPKEVILLQPSLALKSNAYADKYTTSDYRPSSVPGTPGKDYPNYTSVPETSFDCLNQKNADYSYMYSDLEAGCQVFHSCHADGRQDSFLCPLGTIFDYDTQTCDWWYNVRCY